MRPQTKDLNAVKRVAKKKETATERPFRFLITFYFRAVLEFIQWLIQPCADIH